MTSLVALFPKTLVFYCYITKLEFILTNHAQRPCEVLPHQEIKVSQLISTVLLRIKI